MVLAVDALRPLASLGKMPRKKRKARLAARCVSNSPDSGTQGADAVACVPPRILRAGRGRATEPQARLCIWGLDLASGRLGGMGRALAGTPSSVKSSGVKRPRHRQASAVVVGRCPTGAYRAAGPSALGPSPRRTARSLVEENPTCGAAITITGKVPGCLGMHALSVSTAAQSARVRPAHATNAMGLGCATFSNKAIF